jgi:hypothetical protein
MADPESRWLQRFGNERLERIAHGLPVSPSSIGILSEKLVINLWNAMNRRESYRPVSVIWGRADKAVARQRFSSSHESPARRS